MEICQFLDLKKVEKSRDECLVYTWTTLWWTHKLLKNLKTPFFLDIQNSFQWVTGIDLKPNQIFFKKKLQQIRSLEPSKVLAEMGRGRQAN